MYSIYYHYAYRTADRRTHTDMGGVAPMDNKYKALEMFNEQFNVDMETLPDGASCQAVIVKIYEDYGLAELQLIIPMRWSRESTNQRIIARNRKEQASILATYAALTGDLDC